MSKGKWKSKSVKAEHITRSDFEEGDLAAIVPPEAITPPASATSSASPASPASATSSASPEPPLEIKPQRISKSEREYQELQERLNKLEDTDYKAYTELSRGIFSVVAKRYGEHWRLDDEEAQAIGRPLCRIVAKYLGDFKYADEIHLAMILFAVISTRIKNETAGVR